MTTLAQRLVEHLKTKLHDPQFFREAYRDATDDERLHVLKELRGLNALHPADERRRKMTASEIIMSIRYRIRRDADG